MKIPFLLFLYLSCIIGYSQQKKIELLNADLIDYNEQLYGKNVKRFAGNVQLKHENAILSCDTAFYNTDENFVRMSNNVLININDTLHIYSTYLFYDGISRMAKLRKKVKLIHSRATLFCDSLNYDRISNVGYFFNGGKIVNDSITITSKNGYYYVNNKDFLLSDNVLVTHPRYRMYSDTIIYNTVTKIVNFMGFSRIIGKTDELQCKKGWYNTTNDKSKFYRDAKLITQNKILEGDTLIYDGRLKIGEAKNNVNFVDSLNKFILKGNFGKYVEKPESALLTDSAMLILVYNETDSFYVHADTFKYNLSSDSSRYIFAYYHVKTFSIDLQSKCDSMIYLVNDSVIELHKSPVLWNDDYQLTAKEIKIHLRGDTLYKMDINGFAFVCMEKDSNMFDQVKGKKMIAYFVGNKVKKVDVEGNTEAIYYTEDNGEIVGVNKTQCSKILFFVENNKIVKIIFYQEPSGTIYPIDKVNTSDFLLDGFKWLANQRPLCIKDIFIK